MKTPRFYRCLEHGHHDWDEENSTCYSLWHARGRYDVGPVPSPDDRHICPCCALLIPGAVFQAWTGREPPTTRRRPNAWKAKP